MDLTTEARQFLRSTRTGILSTHSAKFSGFPFGSVAPFVLNHDGCPIILISTIAEHTKNIVANPNVSLLVFAGAEDLQANARLTLLGKAVKIDKEDAHLRARYLRYLPQAATYFDMHDFSFYQINITQARYIAGFGKMSWVAGVEICAPQNQLAEAETSIIEHMNADHAENLTAYCKHFFGVTPLSPKMLGIDCDGFDVSMDCNDPNARILRFTFDSPINDAYSARAALVSLAKQTRT
jgi:heme iron utilization protein